MAVIGLLSAIAGINVFCFAVLLGRPVRLLYSLRMVSVARALNLFLFSGTGYLASGYFGRGSRVSFHQAVGSFLIIEFFSALSWLVLGVFSGAQLAFRFFPFMAALPAVLLILFFWQKGKVMDMLRKFKESFKNIGGRAFLVLPCIGLMIFSYFGYYFFLSRIMGLGLDFYQIIKAVSVSYCLGYFSPAPSGLGFKETGLVAAVSSMGPAVQSAVLFALADRIIVTLFWSVLGFFTGYPVIKQELKKRFSKKTKLARE